MFIRKSDGSLHQINESLYQLLENHYFICENDNAYLCEDKPSVSGNEMIISLLKQGGYDISAIKDKRQRDMIVSVLSQKISEEPQNIKQIIKDFIDNPDSIYDNQEEEQPEETPNNNQETNNQANNQETEKQEDKTEPENKGTPEQQKQVQQFANKMNEAYLNIIKKSGQAKKILKKANEKNPNKDWLKLEDVPADILLNTAKHNKAFLKFMLDIRIRNGINSLNLSDTDKKSILELYENDSQQPYEMLRIVGWLSKKEGRNFDIFDFPITDYYIKRYNKQLVTELLDKLADGIVELNTGKWKFGDDYVKEFAEENNLDGLQDKKQIMKKLKEKYSNDFLMYVIRNNNKEINTTNLATTSANDIAKVLMEDKFVGSNNILEVEKILKEAMFQSTLIPFIDYIMSVNYNQVKENPDEIEKSENYAIKITMFGDFSSSSVLQKARDIIKDGKMDYEVEGLKPKISAYFSEISDTIFKNTKNGSLCRVRFQKGFPLLQVITKNVKAGYNRGRNFKGIINI